MKAYILTIIAIALFGLLLIVGELDLALDGLAFSDTRILIGSCFVLVAAWIGFIYYPFYREEIVEELQSLYCLPDDEEDDEEESKEKAEEGEDDLDRAIREWNEIVQEFRR